MFSGEPSRTQYDLSFSLFGFPIRVHPGFFILPLALGAGTISGAEIPGQVVLIFAFVFFISILVHELGHSFALRFFGIPSRIVLYWFGGLAIHDTGGWGNQKSLGNNQQIIVSLAGPAAGFVLAALTVGVVLALNGQLVFYWNSIFPGLIANMGESTITDYESLILLLNTFLFCNIIWGVLNLIPVIPLDGGQVCRELCLKADYRNGLKNALIVSVVVAGIVAVLGFASNDSFIGIFFAFMGISNYMTLQQMFGRGSGRW